MPPELWLSTRLDSTELETRKLPLPSRQFFPFHRDLADYLLLGEPLAAPLEDSVKVVKVLEAAARSMDTSGQLVTLGD